MTAPTATTDAGSAIEQAEAMFADDFLREVEAWEARGGVPSEVFARLGATGVIAARWSPPAGGGNVEIAIRLARACGLLTSAGAGISFMANLEGLVAASHECAFGDDHRAEIDSGRRVGCIAISEATSGSEVTACETLAEPLGGSWRISGHKHYVSNFPSATDCVVFTRTGRSGRFDDFSVFVVPTAAPGVSHTRHRLVGSHASGTCKVDFDGVEVDASRLVGDAGAGLRFLMRFLRFERLWAAVGSVASAELCLEMANTWLDARQLAGSALRERQALTHRLADMTCLVAAARALVAELVAEARAGRMMPESAARGKLFASRVAWTVADETLQFLGGRGFTHVTPLARMWADARMMRIGGGSDEVLREILARTHRAGPLCNHPAVAAIAGAQPD